VSRIWTINGRFLTQKVTGVQRYAHEILAALDAHLDERHPLARDLSLELLVPAGNVPMPPFRHLSVRTAGGPSGHFWEQFTLPLRARGGILSLCNTSTVFQARQIVCVHDLNTFTFPQSYSFAFRSLYRVLIPCLLKTAAAAVTVSHYSADEMARRRLAERGRLSVIPDGHEHVRRWGQRETKANSMAVDEATIVLIGSPAPHKNIDLVLQLAPTLAAHGLKIAVVGRLDARVYQRGGARSAAENIIWVGAVSDDQLMMLYRNCLCLAFPSRAEGFGLPPLEAMALGCPVVSANCASMPEVCGDAALYASPDNPDEWLRAFLALRTDKGLRDDLIQKGIGRARRFSWRRSAELYLELMASLDGVDNDREQRQHRPASSDLDCVMH
jgi:glycosyltransferase involved in cell wall biosynthesis